MDYTFLLLIPCDVVLKITLSSFRPYNKKKSFYKYSRYFSVKLNTSVCRKSIPVANKIKFYFISIQNGPKAVDKVNIGIFIYANSPSINAEYCILNCDPIEEV